MIVYSEKYPGRIIICQNCGCLYGYNEHDIYGNDVYCPLCKAKTTIDYDKNYNGIVENKGEESNASNVL